MSEKVQALVAEFMEREENADLSPDEKAVLERFADWLEEKGEI